MIGIAILAIPGCSSSAVDGIHEVLKLANSLLAAPRFQLNVYSTDGQPVRSYSGNMIMVEGRATDADSDILILPPIMENLDTVLGDRDIAGLVSSFHRSKGLVATVCAGSFFLAETGVLDGKEATTHWNLADIFRSRYPNVNLQLERLLIDGGDYICCGGVSSWMDLSLHLVTRFAGRDISRRCAKLMLMDPHREHQTPYGMGGFRKNHGDESILKVQQYIESNYAEALSVTEMAGVGALGERTFLRRFSAATGKSPGRYLQQVRIEAAQALLETSDLSIEEITEMVGYTDYSSFRKLFKRIMGCPPATYRQRFGAMVT